MPHVLLAAPWDDDLITLPDETSRHLRRVLRLADGDPCTYTDGSGTRGSGRLEGSGVVRGPERIETAPPSVTLAVAPPASRDRVRWLVEKTCELGVSRIRWLRTVHGEGRPPRHDKAAAWAQMALEQSRRVFSTRIDDGWCSVDELEGALIVMDREGDPIGHVRPPLTVLVGPEGGWAPGEVPPDAARVTLGDGVLRIETAAVLGVFAARQTAV